MDITLWFLGAEYEGILYLTKLMLLGNTMQMWKNAHFDMRPIITSFIAFVMFNQCLHFY